MDKLDKEKYQQAGEIGRDVREWSKTLIKPGISFLDLANKIESRIAKLGAEIAFPVNICVNDITAHYAPGYRDESVIGANDVVTVDLGAHVDGFISDTAYTVDLSGKHKKMLKANQEALDAAIELVAPGVSVSEIGHRVQELIISAGYKPIENLTGHEIKQYDLHAGLSIPNIDVPYDRKIKKDMILAIEPFATNGLGRVIESPRTEIYSLIEPKSVRMNEARILLRELAERRKLPFAARWFTDKINPMRLELALRKMASMKILKTHPVLHEKEKGIVSQFEHTMIVTSSGCEVTTI
ncbi:MAG: type II methionyl aminopeptidase [Candidatus Altiarchaeales archaeon ex4484_96]|nr:MAG: type II methionyl aminopeptidase [Candidatus Altiarchaeales archaeon ex4484_96]